ncbi:hypothetical protein ACFL9T_01090 [Thermodesulfobacteriota bacterium]
MGKKKKGKKSRKGDLKKRKKWLIPVIYMLLIGLAAVVFYGLMNRSSTETAPTISLKKESPDFDKLVGPWVRREGGYVIAISKIHPDGKVDAAYFNPRPINVSRANVSEEDRKIKLFVELRDKGYPGSTYTLVYNPEHDVMVGVYFQAAIQQSFKVIFDRK